MTALILTLATLKASWGPVTLQAGNLQISNVGPVITLTWTPLFLDRWTYVYRGQKRIGAAHPGTMAFTYTEEHFGVASLTVAQRHLNVTFSETVIYSLGRIVFDPPPTPNVEGYYVYIADNEEMQDAARYDVGKITDVPIVTFCLAPGDYWVTVTAYRGAEESAPVGPVAVKWCNALLKKKR
jgi:hypothetical protein